MLAEMPLQFEHPIWLLLSLSIIPTLIISVRSIGGLSMTKALSIFALRSLLILVITVAIAHPTWEQRGEGLTVTIILDRSHSVPQPLQKRAVEVLRQSAENDESRRPEDRLAVVTVGREPSTHSTSELLTA